MSWVCTMQRRNCKEVKKFLRESKEESRDYTHGQAQRTDGGYTADPIMEYMTD